MVEAAEMLFFRADKAGWTSEREIPLLKDQGGGGWFTVQQVGNPMNATRATQSNDSDE